MPVTVSVGCCEQYECCALQIYIPNLEYYIIIHTCAHSVFEKAITSQQLQTWCLCNCWKLYPTNSTLRQALLNNNNNNFIIIIIIIIIIIQAGSTSLGSSEFRHIKENAKPHYRHDRVHRSHLSPSPLQVQFLKIYFHILPPSKPRKSKSHLFRFPYKILYAHLFSSMHATCPALLLFLQLITRIIFCEQYKFVIIILLPVLRQDHSPFQSEFSTEADTRSSISSIISFP
jgi:hypothetical protein